ncbi:MULTISPECIES: PTS sugar transporter subunit IIA [Spiribacter]|jgi:PTS system nitrogen regulatory IIA component|uniref:PTS sugar transporter subunit IIA n=1 Tax=Spiribacter aquaticus TaxID=1935996 RepID=A0A557RGZ1_9GAMM|nr:MULTISPECIES: PTS sugar transporter subunit IIA [Spiribacter]KAF0280820.1 PTS sugar transporter subunit IIA [Spiribacter roseus]KAF0282554.1 PTS sugar transporter subunit IIA [Spiribacter roseus]KAF0284431.1 PTS sugar transporter subunit IIA [Spiribacter roseus]TVO64426.1 PTS sugar transporter subunit IIA [Spiribacter aquaticus]
MELTRLLSVTRTQCGVDVTSKKRALERMSEQLMADTRAGGDATRAIFEGLIVRERLGSTGLGRGVALPHTRSPDIETPRAALVRLNTPIAFDAADSQPVDLLLALLVPEHSNDEHLRILARLAELFRDEHLCTRLRQCRSDAELYATMTGSDDGAPDA